jgi:hypothetical protein
MASAGVGCTASTTFYMQVHVAPCSFLTNRPAPFNSAMDEKEPARLPVHWSECVTAKAVAWRAAFWSRGRGAGRHVSSSWPKLWHRPVCRGCRAPANRHRGTARLLSAISNADSGSLTGPSRAGRPTAGSTSPSAPRRTGRPRGCRGSALPRAWKGRAGPDAATCLGRRSP